MNGGMEIAVNTSKIKETAMKSHIDKTSLDKSERNANESAFVNEGGRSEIPRKTRRGPLGVDPTDLTTAKQFDEARRNSNRR